MGLNSPGVPSNQLPPDEAWLVRKVADLERVVRELAPSIAKSFAPVIARLDATDADLIAKQAALDAQQATLTTTVANLTTAQADIAANVASINTLITQVAKPVWSHADSGASSFAVTTTMTNRATATVTVPTGYTQALIFAAGQASAVNTTGSLDTVYVGVSINGTDPPGWASGQDVGPSGFGGATSSVSGVITGLTGGGTFTIAARIRSAFAGWPANASNEANIDATVLFLR